MTDSNAITKAMNGATSSIEKAKELVGDLNPKGAMIGGTIGFIVASDDKKPQYALIGAILGGMLIGDKEENDDEE